MKLAGWGKYPVVNAQLHAPRDEDALRALVQGQASVIARGNGRAYGDAAINAGATLSTKHLNKMIRFDEATGQLEAEAGVILGDVIAAFLPKGWFLKVSPGTKFVTLGGAIAADVHGKNHHKDGSFRSCVDWVDVMNETGQVIRCSRAAHPDLFEQTLGGMGLTGIITRAAFRLHKVESAWIAQTTYPAPNLRAAMELFETHQDATYSVAWIDCLSTGRDLGRSIVMLGEHATRAELPRKHRAKPLHAPEKSKKTFPFALPGMALNRYTVGAFNALYYRKGARNAGLQFVDWDSYFYPLDAILHWNRLYGPKGFAQFQCVLPLDSSEAGLSALLRETARAGAGSFLAVLKRFGAQTSAFSFPMEGYTLALDFPMSPATLRLLERLDAITLDHGGRFYLAKDSRMSGTTLRASDGRVDEFVSARQASGADQRFHSAQSERLAL